MKIKCLVPVITSSVANKGSDGVGSGEDALETF